MTLNRLSPLSRFSTFSPFCRLQMEPTQVSLRSTLGSVDQSQSSLWAQRERPGRWMAAPVHQRTRKGRTVGRVKREHPSTYHPAVWSSSTLALWPPPERSSRACWRSSWCWTIPASLLCTGRRTGTGRVRKTHLLTVSLTEDIHNRKTFNNMLFIFCADLFQKLPLCERPLLLRLIAGPDPDQLSFILKENETGEVEVRKHRNIHKHTYCIHTLQVDLM